jgi:carboxylesterase type B
MRELGLPEPAHPEPAVDTGALADYLGGQRADEILAELTGSPYEALANLFTTAIWTEPTLASYRRFTDLGRTSYAYHFARVSPGNRRTGMLAYHCAELPYLFGHLIPAEDYDEVDAQVSDTIQHAWTEFARTGCAQQSRRCPVARRHQDITTAHGDRGQGRKLPAGHLPGHADDQLHSTQCRQPLSAKE